MKFIKDYLQTQGLRLDTDLINLARLAAYTVMNNGQAIIEREILWQKSFVDYVEQSDDNEALLKQIFMALDSAVARQQVQTAVVYGLLPENEWLLRLTAQGCAVEDKWLLNDNAAAVSLAARTAITGWANIADNVSRWLEYGELTGEHNRRCISQLSLPIADEDGKIYGVVHVESDAALDEVAQAEWVGLALALLQPLKSLFPKPLEQLSEKNSENIH